MIGFCLGAIFGAVIMLAWLLMWSLGRMASQTEEELREEDPSVIDA